MFLRSHLVHEFLLHGKQACILVGQLRDRRLQARIVRRVAARLAARATTRTTHIQMLLMIVARKFTWSEKLTYAGSTMLTSKRRIYTRLGRQANCQSRGSERNMFKHETKKRNMFNSNHVQPIRDYPSGVLTTSCRKLTTHLKRSST